MGKCKISLNAKSLRVICNAGVYIALIGLIYGAFCIHASVGIICLGAVLASLAAACSNHLKKTAEKEKEE